jgi:hypothetical protein
MQKSVLPHYSVRFQSRDRSWLLSGPVGARGRLLFQTAREAASHARWAARSSGGVIEVFDPEGQIFKTIEVEGDETSNRGYVLPSV